MNSIHPSAMLIGDVRLGAENTIGALAVIIGPVVLGSRNWIGTGAVIGAPPEIRDWPHPRDPEAPESGNGVEIGNGNTIREYVQIHQGWHDLTRVGNDVFIMNQTYVAHDCQIEDGATLASSVLLAGHVRIGRRANLGLGASVHQGRYVADDVMVGMGSVVTRDLPPFSKAYGSPARVHGSNSVGMRRLGLTDEVIDVVESEYSADPDFEALRGTPELFDAVSKWEFYEGLRQ